MRSALVGKCRLTVPVPTPASAAIWRTGASTPEVTNTAAAAFSRDCSLRRASARLCEVVGLAPAGVAPWVADELIRPEA